MIHTQNIQTRESLFKVLIIAAQVPESLKLSFKATVTKHAN